MPATISPAFRQRIESALFVWLTTLRDDGMPQPTPVWFILDADDFLIYSQPHAHKVANIRANPKVALNFAFDERADIYIVVTGEATFDSSVPQVMDNPAYMTKYEQEIYAIDLTPEQMSRDYSTVIRVKPARVRGLGIE
jgi:PPOX class probable F420-dependent enzyme